MDILRELTSIKKKPDKQCFYYLSLHYLNKSVLQLTGSVCQSGFVREQVAIYIVPDYFQRKEKVKILQPRKLRNYSKKNRTKKDRHNLHNFTIEINFSRSGMCHKAILLKTHLSKILNKPK